MTDPITKYLPSAWLDEDIPAPEADPSTFLSRATTGEWMMQPDEPEEWSSSYSTIVEHGQIVPFLAQRHYGHHVMTVDANGKAWIPTVPEEANCFVLDDDIETFADSAQQLADNGVDGTGGRLDPGEYDISAWFWADEETHFRVVIEGDKARFEPTAGTN